MSPIEFFVPGEPKAQPRPRAFARRMGDKFVARVYDAGTAEGWKSAIALAARGHIPASPMLGPIRLTLDFAFARPRSHYGTGRNAAVLKPTAPPDHIGKPDLDNLEKAVMDCLTTLGFWGDDSQVWSKMTSKSYSREPGVRVCIHAKAAALAGEAAA